MKNFAALNTAAVAAFDNTAAAPAAETTATKTSAPRVEPDLAGVGFKLPTLPEKSSKRGSQSLYPFDKLAVGEAFGVKNKTAANLSSIVSNANRKNTRELKDAEGNTVYETKVLKGADGSETTVPDTSKPKREAVKHFYAIDVDGDMKKQIKGTPLEGSTVLVCRDK